MQVQNKKVRAIKINYKKSEMVVFYETKKEDIYTFLYKSKRDILGSYDEWYENLKDAEEEYNDLTRECIKSTILWSIASETAFCHKS